jgi:hypothetical protein
MWGCRFYGVHKPMFYETHQESVKFPVFKYMQGDFDLFIPDFSLKKACRGRI